MNLVDNVYLIVSFCRAIGHFLADFTDVVHTVVGCGIDLDHVHRGAGLYRLTHFTFTTGASIYRVLAAEQIGVSDTVRLDLIGQRGHNVILALDIIEIIRSELPV